MDPGTLKTELTRLQAEQARLRDDARFLIEHADRLAEATEQLALMALTGEQQPPPPRRPPGRRQPGHRREHHVRLRLIQGGIAAAVAAVAGWRLYLRGHVVAATAAGAGAAVVAGTVAAMVAVSIVPANPGTSPGSRNGVTVQPASGTSLTPHHARRRRHGLRVTVRPSSPRRGRPSALPRPSRTPAATASPSPVPSAATPEPTLPVPVPTVSASVGPVCVLGICL